MLRTNIDVDKFEIILSYSNDNRIELLNQADITIAVSSAGMTNTIKKDILSRNSNELYELLIAESNGNFYYIGTKNFGFNNNFLLQKDLGKIPKYKVYVNQSTVVANNIEKSIWGKYYIDLLELLMDKEKKVSVFTPDGDFISFDTEHATEKGAKFIGNILLEKTKLKKVLE